MVLNPLPVRSNGLLPGGRIHALSGMQAPSSSSSRVNRSSRRREPSGKGDCYSSELRPSPPPPPPTLGNPASRGAYGVGLQRGRRLLFSTRTWLLCPRWGSIHESVRSHSRSDKASSVGTGCARAPLFWPRFGANAGPERRLAARGAALASAEGRAGGRSARQACHSTPAEGAKTLRARRESLGVESLGMGRRACPMRGASATPPEGGQGMTGSTRAAVVTLRDLSCSFRCTVQLCQDLR